MRRVELARHNQQLHLTKVRRRLRRKILAAAEIGECVLVDADGAVISQEELAEILEGIPASKVRVIYPRGHGTKPEDSLC